MRDSNALIEKAFLLLQEVYPVLAHLLWLHSVLEMSEVELATDFQKDVKSIRRQLNGYTRDDGKYIWGAKDYLKLIYRILQVADRHECLEGLEMAFQCICEVIPGNSPFPATLIELFLQAIDRNALVPFLKYLQNVSYSSMTWPRQKDTFRQLLLHLAELYDQNRLVDFFKKLPTENI